MSVRDSTSPDLETGFTGFEPQSLNYVDLITQAITSAPDQRLRLKQIYEWMVQNVPFLKDKGDDNSCTPWKSSVRGNLTRHIRFTRVWNEKDKGAWTINPDSNSPKSVPRRRSGRSKASKPTSSSGSSVREGPDLFPDSPLPSGKHGRLTTGRNKNRNRDDRQREGGRQNMSAPTGAGVGGGGEGGGGGGGDGGGGGSGDGGGSSSGGDNKFRNTYGLSTQFLESLGIEGPLVTRVFVANLDYKVDERKLIEVFKLAGEVLRVELWKDKDGKSKGCGVVEYARPVESVQAISMFHDQRLDDRRMTVILGRASEPEMPPKLPEGLKGIGMELGADGNRPLDVARNIPGVRANDLPGGGGGFSGNQGQSGSFISSIISDKCQILYLYHRNSML